MKIACFEATSMVRRGIALAAAAFLLFPTGALGEGKLYWTDPVEIKVQRANLSDGSNIEDVFTTVILFQFALDRTSQQIYWVDMLAGEIIRSSYDGGNREVLLSADPNGIALDLAGGKIYITDSLNGKIQRANLGGSDLEDLVSGLLWPVGIALDVAGGKMYWADRDRRQIQRPLDDCHADIL